MSVIALASAKSGTGVSTAALALALGWPQQRHGILAELDPLGGDIAAGYAQAAYDPARGLVELVSSPAARAGDIGYNLPQQTQPLAGSAMGWLRGLDTPMQAPAVPWAALADMLRQLPGTDVLADCGALLPIGAQAAAGVDLSPIWLGADVVALVMRPTLPAVRLGSVLIPQLLMMMRSSGHGPEALGLLLTSRGAYSAREIQQQLKVPVIGELPHDSTELLSSGRSTRTAPYRLPLVKSAARIAQGLIEVADRRSAMTAGQVT